jgi:hypothetical protein
VQAGLEKPRRGQKTGEATQGENSTHGQPRVVMPLQVGAKPPEHALPGLMPRFLGDWCRAQIDLRVSPDDMRISRGHSGSRPNKPLFLMALKEPAA